MLERLVARYGYTLARESERIPRGASEPFATAEYDVLPRGRFDFVRRDYYSPIPDLEALPADIFTRRSDLGGVALDATAGIELIEQRLAPHVAELDVPPEDPGEPGVFFLRNTGFESVDAELLYAMVRARRPRRVVELGSGYTTLLIGQAVRRNHAEGIETSHVAYDPFPRPHVLGEAVSGASSLQPVGATDVPLEVFDSLGPGDILFVDTTHTVKLGSDVNFIVLDVLPRLKPGVAVHFHDVFLPFEYPRQWFEQMQFYWAEQYLLQAFLAFNTAFSILIPAGAVARELPERLGRVIPSFAPGVSPGSLWIERNDRGA